METNQGNIPTPLKRRIEFMTHRYLPVLAFAGASLAAAQLWSTHIIPRRPAEGLDGLRVPAVERSTLVSNYIESATNEKPDLSAGALPKNPKAVVD